MYVVPKVRKFEVCKFYEERTRRRTSRSRKHIFTLGAKDELLPASEITLRSEKICAQGCLRSSRVASTPSFSAVFQIYFLVKICKHVTALSIQLQKLEWVIFESVVEKKGKVTCTCSNLIYFSCMNQMMSTDNETFVYKLILMELYIVKTWIKSLIKH